ncbi:uncharacterized protein LOC132195076 isoform X1 [Neocloeon triangulifer]|uniref:uncharacterized protein LOC132195076 isoform X1 n=1 Tax=Neocloeon triangulifer TaxID=2078957 RepID=UPI00286F269B|nr:uncharacterized protein LOC132195076 isoform X1 [Neocloeon triangulifer]
MQALAAAHGHEPYQVLEDGKVYFHFEAENFEIAASWKSTQRAKICYEALPEIPANEIIFEPTQLNIVLDDDDDVEHFQGLCVNTRPAAGRLHHFFNSHNFDMDATYDEKIHFNLTYCFPPMPTMQINHQPRDVQQAGHQVGQEPAAQGAAADDGDEDENAEEAGPRRRRRRTNGWNFFRHREAQLHPGRYTSKELQERWAAKTAEEKAAYIANIGHD